MVNKIIVHFSDFRFVCWYKMAAMEKTHSETSIASISSDQLEEETLDLDLEFDVAPFDIMGEHESVGVIRVVTMGEILSKTAGYKRYDRSSIQVKFHVNKMLEIVQENNAVVN